MKDPIIESDNCANCGKDLIGKYCYNCGQKKVDMKDRSVRVFLTHFVEELFTFDTRFYRSIIYLLFKPGLLTHEYISGRFISYISPLKMYLFTSLVSFFIMINMDPDMYKGIMDERDEDNIFQNGIISIMNDKNMSEEEFQEKFNDITGSSIAFNLFFIIIFFSILLKLIYIAKNIFYVEHLIFTFHFFTFVLICYTLGSLIEPFSTGIFYFFFFIVPCFYLLFAIKKVYHRNWLSVLPAAFILSVSYWFLSLVWVVGTVFIAALRV
jgi:Protein of unknown function (DUF3667)